MWYPDQLDHLQKDKSALWYQEERQGIKLEQRNRAAVVRYIRIDSRCRPIRDRVARHVMRAQITWWGALIFGDFCREGQCWADGGRRGRILRHDTRVRGRTVCATFGCRAQLERCNDISRAWQLSRTAVGKSDWSGGSLTLYSHSSWNVKVT